MAEFSEHDCYLCEMHTTVENLLSLLNLNELTPVQREVIDNYRDFEEIIFYAPTGTGKTLAFLLPLTQLLQEVNDNKSLKALIITPTRELATQIESVFKSLKTNWLITACYGGHPLHVERNNLAASPDVVVGTPGRLIDHMENGFLTIQQVSYLVIDEFDKCLELGFSDQIASLYGETRDVSKLFLGSATRFEKFPVFLKLSNPITIDKTEQKQQPDFSVFQLPASSDKMNTLHALVSQFSLERTIIFCNFREDVERLKSFFAENRIVVVAYHGGLEQDERERALIKFRNNSAPVLVCTDLGARGLDIPEVKHIVHYALPYKAGSFTHRNGRTARMHAKGAVYVFQEDMEKVDYSIPVAGIFAVNYHSEYKKPLWVTLYFSGGKKHKINKIDLFAFLCQKGGLQKEQVGVITVLDYVSYAAVLVRNLNELLRAIRNQKVKGQKLKIDRAY